MAKKCFKNQVTDPNAIPVDSVIWTGDDLDCLDICNGESISPLLFNIATRVCELIEATNIEDVTLCGDLIATLGAQDKTIGNLLQILLDESCSLRDFIEQVQTEANTSIGLTLDFKCISTQIDPCTPTDIENLSQVLQVIINAFCDLKTQFDTINDSVDTIVGDTIEAYLDQLFESDQTNRIIKIVGDTPKYKFRGFVPPNCPIPYTGSLTYFNSSGVGSGIMTGWFLCNGQNGTTDMRGRIPVCAILGMGGGTLDNDVNPSLNIVSPTANYAVGTKGGKIFVNLTPAQLPNIAPVLNVVAQPMTFTYKEFYTSGGTGTEFPLEGVDQVGSVKFVKVNSSTNTLTPSITVTASPIGNGQSHENRMPYIGVAYIQMID